METRRKGREGERGEERRERGGKEREGRKESGEERESGEKGKAREWERVEEGRERGEREGEGGEGERGEIVLLMNSQCFSMEGTSSSKNLGKFWFSHPIHTHTHFYLSQYSSWVPSQGL